MPIALLYVQQELGHALTVLKNFHVNTQLKLNCFKYYLSGNFVISSKTILDNILRKCFSE